MSEALPDFNLLRPATLDEAVAMLQTTPAAKLCAGGTDLIVNLRHGLVDLENLIDLSNISELKTITADGGGLYIGAGVTLGELAENAMVADSYTAIHQAALAVAGPSHRTVATVGGNLCLDTRCLYYNQSHWWRKSNDFCLKYQGDICHVAPKGNRCRAVFSGDLAPAFMVFGAEVGIIGPGGARRIALPDLYLEDGADYLTLKPGEIITGLYLPAPAGRSAYGKVRIRGAIDFPLAGVAVRSVLLDQGVGFTLAVTGTNSCPVLVDCADILPPGADSQAFFTGLGKQVQQTVSPQRTSTVEAHYRRLSVAALATRLAQELANG